MSWWILIPPAQYLLTQLPIGNWSIFFPDFPGPGKPVVDFVPARVRVESNLDGFAAQLQSLTGDKGPNIDDSAAPYQGIAVPCRIVHYCVGVSCCWGGTEVRFQWIDHWSSRHDGHDHQVDHDQNDQGNRKNEFCFHFSPFRPRPLEQDPLFWIKSANQLTDNITCN